MLRKRSCENDDPKRLCRVKQWDMTILMCFHIHFHQKFNYLAYFHVDLLN